MASPMTLHTYAVRLAECRTAYNDLVKKVNTEFALSNSTFKVGDKVKDFYKGLIIEVDSVRVSNIAGTPSCVYVGYILKKSGEYRKDMYRASVSQIDAVAP